MVLTIAALDSAGKVDNWIVGKAHLELRFCRGICCLLPIACSHVSVFSPGLMMIMAMVMMAMVMALVMVS